jgi:outer membrane protein assembly factor BamB
MLTKHHNHIALTVICILLSSGAFGADWPMWRHDPGRSAETAEELPADLKLQWIRHLPKPMRAWRPKTDDRLRFDVSYEPVVKDQTLFVPSNLTDSVTAYSTETGAEKWRFYADGPVRFAPLAWKDRLYFVSDDSYLYCLNAATGDLIWRFRGAPQDRRILGNERLISMWPARGAPVLMDGVVYFSAGIWPFMGVLLHAVDAQTGNAIWTNSGTGSSYIIQPHHSPAFAGVAPQGYLVGIGKRLLIPGGRSMPACFDRITGKLIYFDLDRKNSSEIRSSKHGSYHVTSRGGWAFTHSPRANQTMLSALASGDVMRTLGPRPVLSERAIYTIERGSLIGYRMPTTLKAKGSLPRMFRLAIGDRLKNVHVKAGTHLYLGGRGILGAVKLSADGSGAKLAWQKSVTGMPWSMLVADRKLFVVTEEGLIYCFGEGQAKQTVHPLKTAQPILLPRWTQTAKGILNKTGARSGYGLVFGAGDGGMVTELVRQSALRLIVIDPDAKRIRELRKYWISVGLYGDRIVAHTGNPLTFPLPPYMASLIVSADQRSGGCEDRNAFKRRAMAILRPYGGVAYLGSTTTQKELVLRRKGRLPGAGDWTHQYADSANSIVSKDARVKLPLGLLWFGGPSNKGILPKHGHGPSPQVAGGRLIIEGPDLLRCLDVYTGRLLWERELTDIGKPHKSTAHQAGANAVGSNYVTLPDAVYVNWKGKLLRLDPTTGKTVAEFAVAGVDKATAELGYLAVSGDVLVVGVSPVDFEWSPDFTRDDIAKIDDKMLAALIAHMNSWQNLALIPKAQGQDDLDYVVHNLNKLIVQEDITRIIVQEVPEAIRGRAMSTRRRYQSYLKRYLKQQGGNAKTDAPKFRALNRLLLTAYYRVPAAAPTGRGKGLEGTASKRLMAMNRHTGKPLWAYDAVYSLRHNAIAIGGGKLFCIDALPATIVSMMRRRGEMPHGKKKLIALDLKTGKEAWSTEKMVFGTWLGYSTEHDLLLQAGSRSRDRLFDEEGNRMAVLGASDGRVLWDKTRSYPGPCLLHGDRIIAQTAIFNLLNGERATRKHPLTGQTVPFGFRRNYGCNTVVASKNLITFRSAAAAFFDLANDGGTGNLGGFKSGCTSNLIAANGVLNAPDYTRTCVCSYQNQSSLALVHMPDVEVWTFNDLTWDKKTPVQRVGINFGAPGDRRADNGTLWLDYPSVGGRSPDLPVTLKPAKVEHFRFHSTLVKAGKRKWVAASGVKGLRRFELTLAPPGKARSYTVRLHFLEPDAIKPGARIFDVALQGRTVLDGFDIRREAGGPRRAVVKTFQNVQIGQTLVVSLTPKADSSIKVTVLCGLEVVAE